MISKRNWNTLEKVNVNDTTRENAAAFELYRLYCYPDETFPNNESFPLIVFSNAWHGTRSDAIRKIKESGWTSPWAWGIGSYHHYHSTAWEFLLCVSGRAKIQLGGPHGLLLCIRQGDALLIPPGLAHKQVSLSSDFLLLGSYPTPLRIDNVRKAPTDQQLQNIMLCSPPDKDPVWGLPLSLLYT